MALGEKRLFSLLNATVSHEMRNPTNSIQALVHEQQKLNQDSKEILDGMTKAKFKSSRKKLMRNLK